LGGMDDDNEQNECFKLALNTSTSNTKNSYKGEAFYTSKQINNYKDSESCTEQSSLV
jgi:hypothetical protein